MIQYILISILIYVILVGIIIFLIFLLRRKRVKMINEYNNSVIEKEKIKDIINKKSNKQKKEVENDIKKANSFNDLINIFNKL